MNAAKAMKITLSAAHSRLADPSQVMACGIQMPTSLHLSRHQLATFRALTEGKPGQIIFNTALTGDGKSLASLLPTLYDNTRKLFAMFPTNELMRDQFSQVQRSLVDWKCESLL